MSQETPARRVTARLRAFAAVTLAALCFGCASGPDHLPAPLAQDDVCAIFAERPDWRAATEASARRWGVPVALQMAILWKESSFRADVRPMGTDAAGRRVPRSSAYGYAQAIDGTWDWYRNETGRSRARRTDFADAADFVGWYVAKTVKSNRIAIHDAFGHYVAYHEGHTGYRRGRWQRKRWLRRVATEVAAQTARYRGQLRGCGTTTRIARAGAQAADSGSSLAFRRAP